jgi:DNA repair protein RecO (recombination protein O)
MESIEAINIRSFDYRDSSLILIVFSKEYGRLSLIARGAKKSSKSSKGLLQSFCHNQYILGRKSNLSIISSVDSIDTFSELSLDLDRVRYGYDCLQLIQSFVQEDHAAPELFDLLLHTLRTMKDCPINELADVFTHFKRQLLSIDGLLTADATPTAVDQILDQYIHTKPVQF